MAQDPGSLDPVIFDTAKDLLAWQPSMTNPLLAATVPLAKRVPTSDVQLLAGLDNGEWTYWSKFDGNPQGGHLGNVYNFQYRQYVDAVYYYDHRLVPIPPPVWTNAAHRNGVKMFAVVTSDCKTCPEQFSYVFEDPTVAASQLSLLAKTFAFDGWMFDAEGTLSRRDAANVQATMTLLREKQLEAGYYQAGVYSLNDTSYPFFQAGTFFQSDYKLGWTSKAPAHTYEYLKGKGRAAARFGAYWSVYTNNYADDQPGGIYNGFQYLHVEFFTQLGNARMVSPPGYYQSLGIFGPAWTMYGGHSHNTDPLPTRDQFHNTDRLFWIGDNPTFTEGGTLETTAPAVSNFLPARSSIVAVPFVTRFNTGEGSFFAVDGQRVADSEWNLLGCQDRLPTWLVPIEGTVAAWTAGYTYDDAYDGGSALAFTGSVSPGQTVEYALYLTQMRLTGPPRVTFRYKLRNPGSVLPGVRLEYGNGQSVTLAGAARGTGWLQALHDFPAAPADITRIVVGFVNASPASAAVDAVMGELVVIGQPAGPPPVIIDRPTQTGTLLTWGVPTGLWDVWYYNVLRRTPNGPRLVGRTLVNSYELSAALFTPPGQEYFVQPVATNGQHTALPSP